MPYNNFPAPSASSVLSSMTRAGEVTSFFLKPIKLIYLNINSISPVIVTQPESQKVALNDPATLKVDAYGTGNLKYSWKLNGVALTGKTNSVLVLPAVTASTIGTYTVEVGNETAIVVLSKPARITIDTPPSRSASPRLRPVAARSVAEEASIAAAA